MGRYNAYKFIDYKGEIRTEDKQLEDIKFGGEEGFKAWVEKYHKKYLGIAVFEDVEGGRREIKL